MYSTKALTAKNLSFWGDVGGQTIKKKQNLPKISGKYSPVMNFTCILGTVEVRDPCRRTVLPTVKVHGKYSFQFYLKAITQWKLFNPCQWFFFSPKGF